MICFRAKPPFSDDWTRASFDGPEEEDLALIVLGVLRRQEWEILVSRDGEEEISVDEL